MISTSLLLLHYLLFMDLGSGLVFDHVTERTYSFKSDSLIPACNRVCSKEQLLESDVDDMRAHFGSIPFTWLVDEQESSTIELLKRKGFTNRITLSAMNFNLYELKLLHCNTPVKVHEVMTDEELAQWITITSRIYSYIPNDLKQFIDHIYQQAAPGSVHLYIAWHEDIPYASAMAIYHDDVVTLHYVGTLPECRKKKIGSYITHYAIEQARDGGCMQAVLLSSPMGKTMYERLGFKSYATYYVYGCYNSGPLIERYQKWLAQQKS